MLSLAFMIYSGVMSLLFMSEKGQISLCAAAILPPPPVQSWAKEILYASMQVGTLPYYMWTN